MRAVLTLVLLALPAHAIDREADGRAAAWRIVEAAPGTQACTFLHAQPAASSGAQFLDEGCHGTLSAEGNHHAVTDGWDATGARETDAWTNPRSEMEARTHRYGQQCSLHLDPRSAPLDWEPEEFVGPTTPVQDYQFRCYSTIQWHTDGGTVERAVVVKELHDVLYQRIRLTLTCGSTVDTYDSDAPGPFPQISVGAGGADCSLHADVTGLHPADDGPTVMSEVRTGVQWWVPQQQGGGCGLGVELLAIPLLWRLRKNG